MDTDFCELESETHDAIAHFSGANKGPLEILLRQAQDEHVHTHRREIYDSWMREQLKGAVFVGHVNTDLDSVAGAIGAAALFGGIPAISEDYAKLNGEILFALKEASSAATRLLPRRGPLPECARREHRRWALKRRCRSMRCPTSMSLASYWWTTRR
jgi:hypothetical protein